MGAEAHITYVVIYHVFVCEKITVFIIAICKQLLTAFWVSDRWHYTPPYFEGVGPLSEDVVLDPCQHRGGSIYTGTGPMHCLYRVKSKGLGKVWSPCIGRALGELRAEKALIHGTGKCMRALGQNANSNFQPTIYVTTRKTRHLRRLFTHVSLYSCIKNV